jgi:3-dehydroquinate synthase
MIQRVDESEAGGPLTQTSLPATLPTKAKTASPTASLLGPAAVDGIECWVSPLTGNTPIHFGRGTFDLLPDLLAQAQPDKVFVITDAQVFQLYRSPLMHLLGDRFNVETVLIPVGETEKSLANLEKVCAELFERGITRSSVVVTFGGGVVLNLGGLAASLTYRGVRFLHVPTTLMAQSDVIISNKPEARTAWAFSSRPLPALPIRAFAKPNPCANSRRPWSSMPRMRFCSVVRIMPRP